jgi:Ni,Fe-hydrogenase III small subunit
MVDFATLAAQAQAQATMAKAYVATAHCKRCSAAHTLACKVQVVASGDVAVGGVASVVPVASVGGCVAPALGDASVASRPLSVMRRLRRAC